MRPAKTDHVPLPLMIQQRVRPVESPPAELAIALRLVPRSRAPLALLMPCEVALSMDARQN